MPSKKKDATSAIVGEYDVELMTEQELRKYAEALKEEHERIRKFRNLYCRDKNELLGCLKSIQENIVDRKGLDLQKNLEIQQLLFREEEKSKYEDALNRITELENNCKDKSNTLEAFINLKMVEMCNKENEDALIKDISDRDRQIQHMQYTYNLMLVQLKEKDFIKRNALSESYRNNFERFVRDYNENFLKELKGFSRNKIEKFRSLWGDILDAESNPFADIVEKMTAYFTDIYWKNRKTIENLYSLLVDLKKELNTITHNLRDAIKVKDQLQMKSFKQVSPKPSPVAPSTFSQTKFEVLDDLIYENYLLSIKLEMLNKEYKGLKAKFVTAVRTVYQKADFKTLLLERKLLSQ